MRISNTLVLAVLFVSSLAHARGYVEKNVVERFSNVGESQYRSGLAVSDAGNGGALVRRVSKEGPAANSGIEVGDIVIAIEGIEITSAKAFYDEIALYDTSVELLIRDKDNASMESYVFIDLLEKGTTQRPKPKPTPKPEPTPKPKPIPELLKYSNIKTHWDAGYGSFLDLRRASPPCTDAYLVESYEFVSVYAHEYESRGFIKLNCKSGKLKIQTGFGGYFEGELSESMDRLIWYNIEFPYPLGYKTIIWK